MSLIKLAQARNGPLVAGPQICGASFKKRGAVRENGAKALSAGGRTVTV
jgi:hypothetical protein